MRKGSGLFVFWWAVLGFALGAGAANELIAGEIAFSPPGRPRAPIRVSNGIPTVKVTLDFGFALVLGNFALDPLAPATMVSPSWLRSQGVMPQFFTDRRAKRIPWAYWTLPAGIRGTAIGAAKGKKAAKPILKRGESFPLFVFQAKAAGVPLDLKSMVPVESALRVDADGDVLCCDGVLGREFFEQFRVELSPGPEPVALLEDARVAFDEKALETPAAGHWVALPETLTEKSGPAPQWDLKSRWLWDVSQYRLWQQVQTPPRP
jgi:hypothetical protein